MNRSPLVLRRKLAPAKPPEKPAEGFIEPDAPRIDNYYDWDIAHGLRAEGRATLPRLLVQRPRHPSAAWAIQRLIASWPGGPEMALSCAPNYYVPDFLGNIEPQEMHVIRYVGAHCMPMVSRTLSFRHTGSFSFVVEGRESEFMRLDVGMEDIVFRRRRGHETF